MNPYVPFIIWMLSAGICIWIAKARHVKPNVLWRMVIVILGPAAIPLMFLTKPHESLHGRSTC